MIIDDVKNFTIKVLQENLIVNSNGNTWTPIIDNIQPAIDDLNTTEQNPGTVWIPQMDEIQYTAIKASSYLTLEGAGEEKTILHLADNVNCNMIENKDKTIGNQNITIKKMTLDGNGLNQDYYAHGNPNHLQYRNHALYFKACNNLTIENMGLIHPSCCGIYAWSPPGFGYNIKLDHLLVNNAGSILEGTGTTTCLPSGIWLECRDGSYIKNTTAHDCYSDGIVIETHWEQSPDGSNYSKNWLIDNCIAYNNYVGIWVEQVRDGIVQNCQTYNNTKTESYDDFGGGCGFVVGMCSFNILIKNLLSHGNLWRNVSLNPYHHITIEDSEIYNNLVDTDIHGFNWPGGGIVIGGAGVATQGWPQGRGWHTVKNSEIHDCQGYGIMSYSLEPKLLHNIINNVTKDGILIADNISSENTDGEVAHNTISNYGLNCIRNWLGDKVNIHDNECQ